MGQLGFNLYSPTVTLPPPPPVPAPPPLLPANAAPSLAASPALPQRLPDDGAFFAAVVPAVSFTPALSFAAAPAFPHRLPTPAAEVVAVFLAVGPVLLAPPFTLPPPPPLTLPAAAAEADVQGCTHSRVSDWLHGLPYRLSSIGVLTAN
jgi:hypothetical protein